MKAESRFLFSVISGSCSLEFSKAVRYILPLYRKYIIIKSFNQLYAVKKENAVNLQKNRGVFYLCGFCSFILLPLRREGAQVS